MSVTRVVKTMKRLPLQPASCLDYYKRLARLFAPSIDNALSMLTMRKVFLVTSTGRTGTTWLATLLNRAQDTQVVHEPLPFEQCAHVQALQDPDSAREYVVDFRIREIAWRLRNNSCQTYGEVNGALRRHVKPLRELLPHAQVIQLVRHPRDVVTSMLNRAALTPDDKVYSQLDCPANIEQGEWRRMGRFEKLCWLWSSDNSYLRAHADCYAVFEKVTRDYSSFHNQILKPLGLDLDEVIWEEHLQLGRNATIRRDSRNETWSDRQEMTFEKLVAPELAHYSYSNGRQP